MSLLGDLKFHGSVSVVGRTALRWERWRSEAKLRQPGFWKNEHLAPPFGVGPRLKELISRHYLKGRYANLNHKVAWVTSGAPVEPLAALGYFLIYPENHGAVCGIRRAAEELCVIAEDAGYSPELCSYARTDIGAALSGKTPVGRLPKPDLLLCCTNICQTVLYWYRVLAHHFKCPLVLIDTPFVYDRAGDHAIEFVKKQLEAGIEEAERVAGHALDPKRFREVTVRAKEASLLWMKVLDCARHRPAPISAFDEFIHLAPIVEMRGEQYTVDYYRALLSELDERVAKGIGAVTNEKARLLWDNLPIWPRIRWLSELLAARGVSMVASTYTNAWGELAEMFDPERPLESAARVYVHPILNQGTGHKLRTMQRMAEAYHANGVLLHSDRSCKPYSVGQIDQRDRLSRELGMPALLLEADHNDPRAFSEAQTADRLDAFLEMLGV